MMTENIQVDRNYLEEGGLQFQSQGKVRDTYLLPDYDDLMLPITSNRISAHDFVLSAEVSGKGQLLNAMSIFWKTMVLQNTCSNDIVAFGSGIDDYLREPLPGNMDLQSRGVVVRKLKMLPIECVVRGHLTGSGWRSYQKDRTVCGIKLPPGLHDGSRLPQPIFTPTTKAQQGHDEPLDSEEIARRYPWAQTLSIRLFEIASEYARERGIIIADTKFEFGENCMLADEVFTPDSSRFWQLKDWQAAAADHKASEGYDKQPVRIWAESVGIDKLSPKLEEHRARVSEIPIPSDLLEAVRGRYLQIFKQIIGMDITKFQDSVMGLKYTTRHA